MANIKFSQFTVGNTESDIDFVVGYKGANNIQISPTNLLAASLAGYLPLTGGTMTGTTRHGDDVISYWGTGDDLEIYHNSSGDSVIQNHVGDLYFTNKADDKDIVFRSDDGSGGFTEYFRLDGGVERNIFSKDSQHSDSVSAYFGSGNNMRIFYNGTHTFVSQNNGGDLRIVQNVNDGDILFQSDDGSGGLATYITIDGSATQTKFSLDTKYVDNAKAKFGDSNDLQIFHNGSNSIVENFVGDLILKNSADDKDIIFQSDDGSGSTATYFLLDGSIGPGTGSVYTRFPDNSRVVLGTGSDLQIYHNSTDSLIDNNTGHLYITNYADNRNIYFRSDDGSGGVTTYFYLDGSAVVTRATKSFLFEDNIKSIFGGGSDLQIYHSGTNSFINNDTGDLYLKNFANDKDIIFQSDDGSGGVTTYFKLDGSSTDIQYFKDLLIADNIKANFGDNADLKILHDGTDSVIQNDTGNLEIQNRQNDGDIVFKSDDGSGGVTEYFKLDGGLVNGTSTLGAVSFPDKSKIFMGGGNDFRIYHNGTDSVLENVNGDLYLQNYADDKDIIFQSDDGSGGLATYFFLDGSQGTTRFEKNARWQDGKLATFGDADDLQIYHDGSNSYIDDTGTGNLLIRAGNLQLQRANGTQSFLVANTGAEVILYYAGNKKFETTSTGIRISGVSEYADNTAAIAGGLTTGDVYRTGDLLKIVH
jgi:hypothetical protein